MHCPFWQHSRGQNGQHSLCWCGTAGWPLDAGLNLPHRRAGCVSVLLQRAARSRQKASWGSHSTVSTRSRLVTCGACSCCCLFVARGRRCFLPGRVYEYCSLPACLACSTLSGGRPLRLCWRPAPCKAILRRSSVTSMVRGWSLCMASEIWCSRVVLSSEEAWGRRSWAEDRL